MVASPITSIVEDHLSTHLASQQRSMVLRDQLVETGFRILQERELDSLNIRDLAAECGVSVGAFYKRFINKDGFLRVLQSVITHNAEAQARTLFDTRRVGVMKLDHFVSDFVGFMIELFNGPARGVIRASYRGSGKDVDTWEPLRDSSRNIRALLMAAIIPKLENSQGAEEKVQFIYQLVNGALINDVLNPWHVYTTDDRRLHKELVRMILSYLK